MKRIALSLALTALFVACAQTVPPVETVQVETQSRFVEYPAFESQHVQPRQVSVWLPPNYSDNGEPYPVIYAHDGQAMMHVGYSGDNGKEWTLDETTERLIAEGKIRDVILVGIWNTDKRWQEYAPQKIMEHINAAPGSDWFAEGLPELEGDAYLKFIATELKPFIDATYNTAAGPEATLTMGSSMGGLISLYAAAEYPGVFSRAACVSIHWPLAGPESEIAEQATAAMQAYLETAQLDPASQRLWFDSGTEDLDAYYPPHAAKMQDWFRARGWNENAAVFRTYEGTNHSETAWAARLDEILIFLLSE